MSRLVNQGAETLSCFLDRQRTPAETLDTEQHPRIVRLIIKEILVSKRRPTLATQVIRPICMIIGRQFLAFVDFPERDEGEALPSAEVRGGGMIQV